MARELRIPRTPPIYTSGIYTCYAPYADLIDSNTVYVAEAIRTFPEMERRQREVYNEIYAPVKLEESIYIEDAKNNASIITLRSSDGNIVLVPNTFIESYPGMAGLKYARNVFIVDVGMIPATIDLEILSDDLKDTVVKNVGADVDMVLDTMRYEGNITHEQHVALETARKATIRQYTPLQQQLDESLAREVALKKQNDELTELIIEMSK